MRHLVRVTTTSEFEIVVDELHQIRDQAKADFKGFAAFPDTIDIEDLGEVTE